MNSFRHVLTIGWLLHTAVAQRFAAIGPAPTLSPRYYRAASPPRPLGKRQAAQCEAGEHTCSDIGPLGATSCCPDDTYCIVDPATGSKAVCCAIGSVCNSPCAESEYQCVVTVTVATASPPTTTSSSACCPRQCTQTSMFGCPSSLGGGCCSYGQTCASASQCLWTSSTSTAATSVVSLIPPGCTTSQIACPSSLGGGCCAATQSCTFVADSGPQCAAITITPTASGVAAVPQNTDGLNTGAKVGIGVGVVVVAGLVVGAATWLVLRRRKKRRTSYRGSGSDPQTYSAGGTASSPPRSSPIPRRTGLALLRDNNRPLEMAQPHPTPVVSRSGRLRGLAADYFGLAAVPGPFTEAHPHQEGDGASPGSMTSTSPLPPGGNNRDRAVPRDPHSPDDITAPVEIDSRSRLRDVSDTIAGRFELYGGDPSEQLASPSYSEGAAADEEEVVVSPYTPSPGAASEGTTVPSRPGWE